MKKHTLKIAGLFLATAATVLTTRADIALAPNLSTYGYAAGFLEFNKIGGGVAGTNSNTGMDIRAAKLGLAFNTDPITVKMSLYDASSKLYLLEANATYNTGQDWIFTAGRFQSWLGYEPFDIPNGNFITNGNEIPVLIPNFHEGVRAENTIGKNTFGVALVDSIYNGYDGNGKVTPFRGTGRLSDGFGFEIHYGYNGGALTAGATAAYQNSRGFNRIYPLDIYNVDLWAQYIIKKTTAAAEVFWQHTEDVGVKTNSYYGLISVKQQISDPLAIALRLSAGNIRNNGSTSYWKVSLAPTYAVNANLGVTAEINYTKYNNGNFPTAYGRGNNVYAGVQACFKF